MPPAKGYTEKKDSGIEWLGKIPNNWRTIRVKYAFRIKKEIAGELGHTVLSVTQRGIKPKDMSEKGQFSLDYSKYQLVSSGDFIMNHMDLLTGWVDISNMDGVTSPDYRVFQSSNPEKYYPDFYRYVFQTCYQQRIFYGLGQGVSGFGRWRLPAEIFLNFYLPVPPYESQSAIAAYLDTQCAKIDEIIAQAKASIEDYKQWKASIIYEAVTKGLDPNVEMKDSGIEWIGRMPAHWTAPALKHLCTMQAGKNLISEQISTSGRYPVYGGNGQRGYYSDYNVNGNFLLVGRQGALCGNVHCVSGKFWATEHAVVTTPSKITNISYLYYLLIAMDLNQYASNSAAQPGLSVGNILTVKTLLPPIDEQVRISEFLDNCCPRIDEVITEKQSLIDDLESYKKSLIYEVVTGKRRVC